MGEGARGSEGRAPGPGALGPLLAEALRGWVRHRASSRGAALAFYALFSLAPVLLLVLAGTGALLGGRAVQGELAVQLERAMGPEPARAVQGLLAQAHLGGRGGWAALAAGVLLGVTATSVFAELKDTLDEIWEVPTATGGLRALLRARALAFALVGVLALLLLATLAASALLGLLARAAPSLLGPVLTGTATFGAQAALFMAIYRLLPEARIPWRDAATGALGTAMLFLAGRFAIGAWLARADLGTAFGAAGSVAALLAWIYYSAQILLLGAEFTRACARWREGSAPG